MYVLPALEKVNEIFFNKEKLYEDELEMEGIPEGEHNKKVFPYDKVLSDIWDIVFDAKNYVEDIRRGNYTKPVSWENRQKRMESQRNKKEAEEKEIKDNAYQKGREMAVVHYEHMKQHSRKSEVRKKGREYNKAYKEGSKNSKEFYKMNEEQILRKAEMIKLERELGFGKKNKEE